MMGGWMQESNKVRIGREKGGECDGDAGNIHDGPWKKSVWTSLMGLLGIPKKLETSSKIKRPVQSWKSHSLT